MSMQAIFGSDAGPGAAHLRGGLAPTRVALVVLALLGALNLVRGGIHLFAPDGGAGSIAGLDVSTNTQAILFLFAAIGILQMTFGLLDLFAVLRLRALVVPLLCLEALKTLAAILNAFFYRPPPVDIPGRWFALGVFAVLASALLWEWRARAK